MARNKTVGYSPASTSGRSRRLLTSIGFVIVAGALGGVFLLGRLTAAPETAVPGAPGPPARGGVPVPNRHTAVGAATAAQNFQIAGFRVSAGTLDARTAADVLLATDATASARQVLAPPTADTAQLAKTRTTFAPLSTVVAAYAPERSVIQVWGVAASSSQTTPQPGGTETWGRSTITMTWDGAQWRVSDQSYSRGPWPARSDQRFADSDGDFGFRFTELGEAGWNYVPEP